RNGITNTGTFTAGTGTYTFITNNQALTGDFNFARITVTGVTLTNNNNLTITTSLAGTGRLTQASGSVLTLSLTAAIGITNLTLNTNPNTVLYNAAGDQTVRAVDYHNLTLTGSGTKTFSSGAITVGGNLTTSGTVVVVPATNLSITGNLDIGNGTTFNGVATLNLAGNFIDNGVFNHNSGTLVLNGNNQNINGLSATTFHNLTAANAAGSVTKSVESSKNLVNVLTVGDNVTFDADGSANNAVFTLRSTGTVNSPDASIGPLLNGATVTGNVRVERNMGQEVNVWRYISTPVSGVGLTQFTDDMQAIRQSIRWYRESLVNQVTRWTALATNAELLVQGRGYHVWMYNNVPVNWDLTGPVYQGSFTWSTANGRLTSTTSTSNTDKDRWNLLGNPYPSPIVWDGNPTRWTIADPNLVATTVYVTDESTGVNFAFNFADGSGADGSGSVYPLLTDGVIARNQAFWVFVSPGASITIHEQAKVAGNQTGYNFFRENKPSVNQLTIAFGNDDIKDEAYFKLNQDATHNMDMRFDIPKLFNENFSIYFIDTFGQQMGMHTVPSLDGISVLPIGYKVAKEGEYSFNIRFKGSVEELQNWYLIDNLNKTAVAISEVIDLKVNIPAGILQSESRFALVKETSANYLDITVGPNPFEDELNIKANEPILSVEMFDLSGKSVFMHQPNEESKSIKLNATGLQSGILITKVKTTTGIYTKKLVKK
ncbi:MAG: T9SS type A sorting domain-containing protein, partial [Chryseotalea sp.]